MRPTAGTATLPTNRQPSQPPGRGSDERGVMTLEWLLIVGAVAALAAWSVLAVQQVLDQTAEVPVDPLVRVLEADIAAAFVAADADTAALSPAYDPADFQQRCDTALQADFGDVVDGTPQWTPPVTIPAVPADPLASLEAQPASLETGAMCVVTPRRSLGG